MDQDNLILSLSIILASLLSVLILTPIVSGMLKKRVLLDIPNARSSHVVPVPRGGGWALMAVIVPALILDFVFIDGNARHIGMGIATGLLVAISWLDDRGGVNALTRLGTHIAAASLGSLCFMPHELLFGGALPFWLDRACIILGWAWFINLYNFMDGIDGITGTETVSIATGIGLVISASGMADPFVTFILLIMTGACLGFLAHNWHPARLFLGDVGSVPLGYLTGFCLLSLALRGYAAPALILPLYYLADSGITIGKRALRGEKIWQAHRQHFYQRAAIGSGHHDWVVLWIAMANIGLIGAALFSVQKPWGGIALGMVIVAVLLRKMHKMAAR